MKILITGSTGYVGRSYMKYYSHIHKFVKFSLQSEQIDDINFGDIETVLHCAAQVHQKTRHSYEEYLRVNALYPIELAKCAKRNGVKHFVFLSTIAVYDENIECLNEHSICNPITYYGKSKLEAEQKLLELSDNNFIISILRAPMIYGKNAPGNIASLVSFIKKMPILPFGNLHNKKSFVYIGNLCNLINVVICKRKNGIFLASDSDSISTTKFIELIKNELHTRLYLIRIPLFESFLRLIRKSLYKKLYGNLEINNTFTQQQLGFKNPYTIENGIKFMINGENI